jgi:hypothetical protein
MLKESREPGTPSSGTAWTETTAATGAAAAQRRG